MWLWLNEWAGCRLNDRLVADHPGIRRHLQRWRVRDKVEVIPYSAERVRGDASVLTELGLEADAYYVIIARPEPENSIREIVSAFSRRKRRQKLVVLGDYGPDSGGYARLVRDVAGDEVVFPGAIYDARVVQDLRAHSRAYAHGHRVGGTNPSLVESLAAGSPVVAHDNEFNRWVAGPSAFYFSTEDACAEAFDALGRMDAEALEARRQASRLRFEEAFTRERVMGAYEELLLELALGTARAPSRPVALPAGPEHAKTSGLRSPVGAV
jgi:glycosyltransferase involved in cell wall biosynthesis